MNRYRLVCFDMDGTLLINMNSVEYLCLLNEKYEQFKEIETKEKNDEITWIEADYLKAKLFSGLQTERVIQDFDKYMKLINNIDKVLCELKNTDVKSILVTAGPIQVAEVLGTKFKFDKVYGSLYEVKDDIFTGKIISHLGDSGKLESLTSFCDDNDIKLNEVVAIGDSASDIKVFEKSGKAIAINYSDVLLDKADVYLKTDNLIDVLEYIIEDK